MWPFKTKTVTPEIDGAKSYEIVVQIGEDGFIPAAQFAGSNLEILLTQATWSYVAMTRVAEDVAGLTGVVQTRDTETGEWVKADQSHDLNQVLRRPFGLGEAVPPWDWQQLIETMSLHHDLTGNVYLRIKEATGVSIKRLLSLSLLDPSLVTPNADTNGVARSYTYKPTSGSITIPADEIVNVMNASPASYYNGVSPLQAANGALTVDYYAHRRQQYDLSQRIAPGVIIKVKNLFGLTPDQRTEVQDMLSESFGTASSQGKPLAIGDNCDVVSGIETKTGDIPELRRDARDEVLAIFRVPQVIAGILDNATLQNSANAMRLYWMQAIEPKASTIYNTINTQAIEPLYGPDVRLWYELSQNELGLAVLKERALVAKALVDLGYPANEAAAKVSLGMPKHDELDVPNVQLVTAGRTEPTEETTEEPEETKDPEAATDEM